MCHEHDDSFTSSITHSIVCFHHRMLVSVNTFPELINEWQQKFPDWGQNHLLWCGGCKFQETLCRDLEIPGRCDGDPVYKEMGFNRDSWRNIRGYLLNVRIQQAPWRKHRLVKIIITGLLPDSPLCLIVERFYTNLISLSLTF